MGVREIETRYVAGLIRPKAFRILTVLMYLLHIIQVAGYLST